jgi:hypothetical protein
MIHISSFIEELFVKKTNGILKSLRTVIYVRPAFEAVLRIRKFALKMPYISSLTFKKDVQAPGEEDSSPLKSYSNIKFIFSPFLRPVWPA